MLCRAGSGAPVAPVQCQYSSGSRGEATFSTGPGWLRGELNQVAPLFEIQLYYKPVQIGGSKKDPGEESLIGSKDRSCLRMPDLRLSLPGKKLSMRSSALWSSANSNNSNPLTDHVVGKRLDQASSLYSQVSGSKFLKKWLQNNFHGMVQFSEEIPIC